MMTQLTDAYRVYTHSLRKNVLGLEKYANTRKLVCPRDGRSLEKMLQLKNTSQYIFKLDRVGPELFMVTRSVLGLLMIVQCNVLHSKQKGSIHDDVIKWKHFPRYRPFVRGFHRSPVNSQHKGQWRGTLMLSLISAWINGWVNNREAGDLRRHQVHYGVNVMCFTFLTHLGKTVE